MKVNKVPALRFKRGLHRVNGAEPQVVGRTPRPIPSPPDGAMVAQSVAMSATLIVSPPFGEQNLTPSHPAQLPALGDSFTDCSPVKTGADPRLALCG